MNQKNDGDKQRQAAELAALESEAASEDYQPDVRELSGPVEKPRLEISEALTGLVMVAFNLIAARRGEHWKLNHDEAAELGGAMGDVVNEYFPGVNMGPLPILGGVAAMVIVPRVMIDQKLAAEGEGGEGGDKSEHQLAE